jgi:hypothetical protein
MIALGSEWRPLALLPPAEHWTGGRSALRGRSYVPSGIRPDALFADPDAERRVRAMSVEGQRLSIMPNSPTMQTSFAGIVP